MNVQNLSYVIVHMNEKHEKQDLNIIHGKIYRKKENLIKITEDLRLDQISTPSKFQNVQQSELLNLHTFQMLSNLYQTLTVKVFRVKET